MAKAEISSAVRNTLQAATDSIQLQADNDSFIQSVLDSAAIMHTSSNRIIVTGMGKSGLIGRKIAATLTSTGTPAVFLHPADALHGDVGNVQKKEVVLALSNSGETRELIELLPHIRLLGAKIVAVTGGDESTLAREADAAIIYTIEREGCPLELAPMASTTVSLVIGDALSAALIKLSGFQQHDFGRFHPSGALGRKLLNKVKEVMQTEKSAFISKKSTFKEIITALAESNLGCVIVTGSKGHLRGIITDGDLKRYLGHIDKEMIWQKTAEDIMTAEPAAVKEETLIEGALSLMHEKKIYQLPVVNRQKKPVGIVRMHDLL